MAIGFGRENKVGADEEAIDRLFTPEFRNRLDATITFSSLPPEVISKVVDKFIQELSEQLGDRKVSIILSEAARKWLAETGYDQLYGARPLGRIIQEKVKKPLADELLFGTLVKGGKVVVDVENGQLSFNFFPKVKPSNGEPSKSGKANDGRHGPEASGDGKIPELVN